MVLTSSASSGSRRVGEGGQGAGTQQDSFRGAPSPRRGPTDAPEASPAAQVPDMFPDADSDVDRSRPPELRSRIMRDSAGPWPARSLSAASMAPELQLCLTRCFHHLAESSQVGPTFEGCIRRARERARLRREAPTENRPQRHHSRGGRQAAAWILISGLVRIS